MSARDALASSLEFISKEQRVAEADYILRRLAAKGYTIIPPGGMHEPTLETLRAARKFIARFDGKMPTASEDEGVFALLERIDEALSHEGERKG